MREESGLTEEGGRSAGEDDCDGLVQLHRLVRPALNLHFRVRAGYSLSSSFHMCWEGQGHCWHSFASARASEGEGHVVVPRRCVGARQARSPDLSR
eukprot:3843678-Rhodomonas_salina.1